MPDKKKTGEDEPTVESQGEVTEISESGVSEIVGVIEGAAIKNGEIPVKIIQPGWGQSGYYSADVLTAAAESGEFDNKQMYIDHKGPNERPERSMHSLAGVVKPGTAEYRAAGPKGPGVYGRAHIFPHYRPMIESVKNHIGLSIYGKGRAVHESVGGKSGRVFKTLDIQNVDFVTKAGAGGAISEALEAHRGMIFGEESENDVPNDKPDETTEEGGDGFTKEAAESLVSEALKANNEKWEKRLTAIEAGQRKSGRMARIRTVVTESSLPEQAAERVLANLENDARLLEESADPDAIAKEAVEAELKYIESITPLHLRRPALDEPVDEAKFEESMGSAMSRIYPDMAETDDE